MSNNPFTNNRFNFLDTEKKSGIPKEKEKKNNNEFDKKMFLRDNDRRDNDRRDNDRRDNDRRDKSNFKPKIREKDIDKPKEFILDDEMFPELVSTINKNDNTSTNFKDMLNTEIIEEEFTGLKPGWIEIYKDKNTKEICYNNDLVTPDETDIIENDPNYIMNKAITFVLTNRNKYIIKYDEMYGEGAYYDKFVMDPVYGPEYDTEEEESEIYSDSYDEYEYSDVYDEF
jgi:hypothetical protein